MSGDRTAGSGDGEGLAAWARSRESAAFRSWPADAYERGNPRVLVRVAMIETPPICVIASRITDATAVSVGKGAACALLSGGIVQCWGDDTAGELGNGASSSTSDGGTPWSATPVTVIDLTSAAAISVGELSACALLSEGAVRCWGDNTYGELGAGTTKGPDTYCSATSIDGGCGLSGSCSVAPIT